MACVSDHSIQTGASMKTIEHLLENSNLPGPRGNLELLYSFAKKATADEVKECLSFCKDDLHNSPEEFVVMCGIAGYCVLNKTAIKKALKTIRPYASHSSWRIREAVAIGIQELSENNSNEIITALKSWLDGNELERRAIVAALCEPKLLKDKSTVIDVLDLLNKITMDFNTINGKLTDNQTALRKALGYGWSVAIVSLPNKGKKSFEKIATCNNKHIQWIVKENLKKNRLSVMDRNWVEKMSVIDNSAQSTILIAPCGMNCGICLAYLRNKNTCKGCRGSNDNKPASCIHCIIKNCESLNRTHSNFCYDCDTYPCKRLKQLDKRYRTKYHMSMIDNLEHIKLHGLDKFTQEEHTRWLCKTCGGTICVHRGVCLICK